MNKHILENAAIFVNAYRKRLGVMDAISIQTLRNRVIKQFGEVYAAILVP